MRKTSLLPLPSGLRRLIGAGIFICLAVTSTIAPAQTDKPALIARLASKSLLTGVADTGAALIAVGERGHILRSEDGGKNWQQMPAPSRAMLTAVTFVSPETGWAVGQDATILATTDGGKSWTQQFHTSQLTEDDSARDAPLLDISCASASICAASGAYGLLLLTTDGGANWHRQFVKEDDRNFYAVQMFDTQHILLAGEQGALMESKDGGAEWTALLSPYDGSFFGFTQAGTDWLVYGLRGNAFLSADQGQSWQKIETGVDSGLLAGTRLSNGEIVLVGAGGVVLESKDNARSFTLHRQSNRAALSAAALADNGTLLLFGEKGISPAEDAQ